MFNGLRSRLTLIFISLAVGPLILVGAIIAQRNFASLVQQSLALQRRVAASVGSEIRAFINQRENELLLLNHVHGLGVLEPKEQRVILSNMLLRQQAYQEVVLLNSEGQEQIRLSRSDVVVDADLKSRAGNVDLRNGEIVAVLVADLRFKIIWDLLADIELLDGKDVYVTDEGGQVVAHRNPAIVLRGTTIDLPEKDGPAEGLSGTNVIVARDTLQFGNEELVVVAEQSVSNALELATDNLRITVAVTSLAFVLAVVLVVLTTRQIVRPIEALATSARAISHGDFSLRVQPSGRDEVGQLASAFNQMASDLKESREKIERYALELESNNEQLQRDVVALKQAEGQQEALIAELEAKNAELERFAYAVSHDLKSPVVTIKGFLGLLEKDMAKGDTTRVSRERHQPYQPRRKENGAVTGRVAGAVPNWPVGQPIGSDSTQ